MLSFLQNQIPLANWVDYGEDWLTTHWAGFFSTLQAIGQFIMDGMTNFLSAFTSLMFMLLLTFIAYFAGKRKWQLPVFTFIGLFYIYNQQLWADLMNTITLVIISSLISIVIGIPLGIWMSKSQRVQSIVTPILDFMQTMPGFVYLIPAVAFFGIGMVPGVFASVIYAMPPTVRMTNLGIRQVPKELVEASDSFGGTAKQKLFKLELPLAKGNIFAGVNQTLMLALSMVVIASMIGAPGLGQGVLSAVQRSQVGNGFVYGLGIVILDIIMDRFTQNINKVQAHKVVKNKAEKKASRTKTITVVAAIVAAVLGSVFYTQTNSGNAETGNKGNITLSYVEWDTEVASTNVVAQVLEDMGYQVKTMPLDNAVNWEAIAKGEADASTAVWLPVTHKAQYAKFKDQVDYLGPSLDKAAKLGIVVPSYMDVDSIEDLKDQVPNKEIIGIEPGAGVVAAAQKTQETYSNLSDWKV